MLYQIVVGPQIQNYSSLCGLLIIIFKNFYFEFSFWQVFFDVHIRKIFANFQKNRLLYKVPVIFWQWKHDRQKPVAFRKSQKSTKSLHPNKQYKSSTLSF